MSKFKIMIDRPGVYMLDLNGSAGKTYLFRLLSHSKQIDASVSAYTYVSGLDYVTQISKDTATTILLDRADLYMDDVLLKSINSMKDRLWLIDMKNAELWTHLAGIPAFIHRTEDMLEVTLDATI